MRGLEQTKAIRVNRSLVGELQCNQKRHIEETSFCQMKPRRGAKANRRIQASSPKDRCVLHNVAF
ncbi:hypothetical protein Mnod_4314 [Methylobacterium nodulans ORS 2060]|uniref:Uncharacterized protein n=1 Tax=Methylobacterium nodulans (strain LMG 21967 / CNCM I-2342 / ORS 2060) TaxID=460265 RepID=B8IAC7_METNO|nr:hypothetical protein Mnod_4314 [Methylobacterium nodulans ORS 2060]